jgi:hypothetical protein
MTRWLQVALAIAISVLALACSKSYAPKKPTGLGAHFDFAELSPTLKEGETLHWALRLGSLARAELKIAVGPGHRERTKKSHALHAVMRTRGFARWLVEFDDEATTWLSTRAPTLLARQQMIRRKGRTRSVLIENRGGERLDITRNSGTTTRTGSQVLDAQLPLVDLQSLLLSIRGWTPAMGRRTTFLFLAETRVWRAEMEHSGIVATKSHWGTRRAHRFDGYMRRLPKSSDKEDETSPTRHFSIWLSADEERLPLKLVAETSSATVHGELRSHEAGPTAIGHKAVRP